MQHVAPVEDFPPAKWEMIIALNLSAAFHTARLAVPHMKAQGWGRIINTASAHSQGRKSVQIRLCCRQARDRRANQDARARTGRTWRDRQLHQPGLCLDPSGRKPDPRHDGGTRHDPRAGDERRPARRSSRPRNSSRSRKSPRWRCSCAATWRRTLLARTTRSMGGGRRSSGRFLTAACDPVADRKRFPIPQPACLTD